MEEKRKVIEVSDEVINKIIKDNQVTKRTVQSALQYITNSPSARMFRAYALNNGGEIYEITKRKVENPYKEAINL
ncbi:MAG: hypothetical protein ACK5N4_23490 [Parabacteroides gordonii]|uniref:hypothetical protein n=1 Tax=Parabacteroides TaxID=375288 RepID=UPI001CCC67DF|nr:hypothetical protein [Parabacteroides goldsteinii]UBD75682.1 hypothetical protein K6V26_04885 [Parabacteroides goldsteinii]